MLAAPRTQKKARPLTPRTHEAKPRASSAPLGGRGKPPAALSQPRRPGAASPAAAERRGQRKGVEAVLSSSNPLPHGSSSARGNAAEKPRTPLRAVLDSLRCSPRALEAHAAAPEGPPLPRLPASAPGSLEPCDDGCYWRWFVQTLADDVDALKLRLDECHGALQQRSEERRGREQVIEHQDLLRTELAALEGQLEFLRLEAPKLREEHVRLDAQAVKTGLATLALQGQKNKLSRELEANRAKQHGLVADAEDSERRALEGKDADRVLQERALVLRDNERGLQGELLKLTAEHDQLRQEVDELNAMRDKQKSCGRKRKPRKV